jgi:hypothetical protein
MAASRNAHVLASLAIAVSGFLTMGTHSPRANFDDRLLASHNRERATLGLPAMEWDAELAASADIWASHLARTGRFEHSPDDAAEEAAGENLWAGTAGTYQPESMVGLWIEEKRDFKPGVFPNNSVSGEVTAVSHYTQVVWARSRRIGCALRRGAEEDFLVCRYKSAGNVMGQSPLGTSAA